jgi:hypothetical protein
VCPRAGVDGCGKSRPNRDSIPPPTVQPEASHYTDCAILVMMMIMMIIIIIIIIALADTSFIKCWGKSL